MNKFFWFYHKTGLVYSTIVLMVAGGLTTLWLGNFSDVYLREIISQAMHLGSLLFVFTFAASSLRYFYKSDFTVWALKNRRYLGLSCAVAFMSGMLYMVLRAFLYPEELPLLTSSRTQLSATLTSGLFVLAMLAMTVTSSNKMVRILTPERWKILHLVGSYIMFGMVIAVYVNVVAHNHHFTTASIVIAYLFLTASLAVWGLRVHKYVHKGAFKNLVQKGISREAGFLLLLLLGVSISSLYLFFLSSLVLV